MKALDLQDLVFANPQEIIHVSVAPNNIDRFNKIVEAYDNLALVSTLDADAGRVVLWVTADTKATALKLLRKMPFPVKLLYSTNEESEGEK